MSISEIASRLNQQLSNTREYLDNKETALVSPKSALGVSGWEFDIPQSENVRLTADITDHYTESNTFLNDHIVRQPIRVTLSGLKGELVYRRPGGFPGDLQELTNRLEIVDAYLGDFTPGMLQSIQRGISRAQSAVSTLNQTLNKTQNMLSALSGEGPEETLQEKAYRELKALFRSNQLVTVQTPWEFFDNMIIESLSFTQGGETTQKSEIQIILKEMRFADIEINSFDQEIFPVREQIQATEEQDVGIVKGARNSFLFETASATGVIQ